jgi:hypothetical protein
MKPADVSGKSLCHTGAAGYQDDVMAGQGPADFDRAEYMPDTEHMLAVVNYFHGLIDRYRIPVTNL